MNFKAVSETTIKTAEALDKIRQAVILATEQSCDLILEEAQAICPVDSNELHDSGMRSVRTEENQAVGTVAFTAPHAAFVEFGTGIRGMGTYPGPLPTEGVPFTGAWVYDYKHQNWIGHAAQPYLRPAVDIARERVQGIYASDVKMALK
jgi:HK97 gp10 family phage protein